MIKYFLPICLIVASCSHNLHSQFGAHSGPSFDWKHHNPELQTILDELRAKEAAALEKARIACKFSPDEWKNKLEILKKSHRTYLNKLSKSSTQISSPAPLARPCDDIPPYIMEEFAQQLQKLGIDHQTIQFGTTYNKYDDCPAATNSTGFIVNTAHPIWKFSESRVSTVAHEITHFLEGHIFIQKIISQHTGEYNIYNRDNDYTKSSELIADLLLAIYDRDIAYATHLYFSDWRSRPEQCLPDYAGRIKLSTYTQRIIAAHEKEFYPSLSLKKKIEFTIAKLFIGPKAYRLTVPKTI